MGLDHFTAARDALDNFEFEEQRGDDLVVKEAIGVAGLVTPWNFPTNQTSFTGSGPTGSKIMEKAAKDFKKYLLN